MNKKTELDQFSERVIKGVEQVIKRLAELEEKMQKFEAKLAIASISIEDSQRQIRKIYEHLNEQK